MRKILVKLFVIIFISILSLVMLLIDNINTFSDLPLREVSLDKNKINDSSYFQGFDSYTLNHDKKNKVIEFNGLQNIPISDLYELDLINSYELEKKITTSYKCVYDYKNEIVSLNVYKLDNNQSSIINQMDGKLIKNKNNEFDVIFHVDGEKFLLSEMSDLVLINNCGFWSRLKKIWNTTIGKIGTIVTVAACVTVGVVCAVIPGAQLGTALAIGAAVGVLGGGLTAGIASYVHDGKIDWYAVIDYAIAGGVIGAISAGVSFKITSVFIKSSQMKQLLNAADKNPYSKTTYIGKYQYGKSTSYEAVAKANKGNFFQIDNYDALVKKYGKKAMDEVNKNFIIGKVKASNRIISTTRPNGKLTGGFAKEINWLKQLGYNNWKKIGENLWRLII